MNIYLKLKSFLRNPIRSFLLFFYHIKNISFLESTQKKQLIICFDGFSQHGGLVDRLKGIISFYETANLTGFEFKIYHVFPYKLEAFLEPNQYNWIATKEDMKWHPIRTKFFYSMLDFKLNPIDFFSKTTNDKIFVYNNIDYFDKIFPELDPVERKQKWSSTFHLLFKKSNYLIAKLEEQNLPKNRIAIHSRFTSILGDFVDTDSKILPLKEQTKLFQDLETNIKKIAKNVQIDAIYVFSDSIIYLNYMKENTTFNILVGEPIHPDNENGYSFTLSDHAKSFIDFFAIAESKEIFLVRKSFMYPSAYPKFASYLNDINFNQILID